MKRLKLTFFRRTVFIFGAALLLLGASCSYKAQVNGRGAVEQKNQSAWNLGAETVAKTGIPIPRRLLTLFDLCQSGRIDEAARYFVYRGADKFREWKDTYRASDSAEKAEVRDACLRINGYLDKSNEGYQFGEIKVEREQEGEWNVIEVSFKHDGQIRKVLFAFLSIKGQYAIGDIDG
jgi:hypothetical protein